MVTHPRVLTVPGVVQLCWSRPMHYYYFFNPRE